ncbi:Cof-type HAD-IIB family hydrolase [Komagataeibacter medellinensis]|uniref:Hydrolase n=1 Tax=Komagataeibacter medellinensis (strain NBRC 3288 / BCRC 11682 / LMG 1693 / Kondo 51) TaxID=634177 RepID=G2I0M8_KOMMN|nr:Cof-type HAD-IIB family hydrolase [Komagataeibacter medellinensis]BAK84486.1 hydrolase [Komagataeibacter medellinensis NBRC 3288]
MMPMTPSTRSVRLVVSDIDGTLITPAREVTPAAHKAADDLRAAGIRLSLVSSRAPRGMMQFVKALRVDTPIAGLNGGLICDPDGTIRERLSLDPQAARTAVEFLLARHVEPWLFIGHDWLVRRTDTPQVIHEREVVQTTPVQVDDFAGHYTDVGKIMGVTSDPASLPGVEHDLANLLGGQASVHRSAAIYLDITHPQANKGYAAKELAHLLDTDIRDTACIGDMNNDIPMLREAGVSIAMGNAPDNVKAHARFVTKPNTEDGWAFAMESFVLPRT